VRDWSAALVAGIFFGCSPFVAAHLNGHFNLVAAWTLPLFALCMCDAADGSAAWSAAAGLVAGVTADLGYYYVVFEAVLAVCIVWLERFEWSMASDARRPQRDWVTRAIATAILLDAGVMVAIMATGGFSFEFGFVRILVVETFNLRQVFWALSLLFVW